MGSKAKSLWTGTVLFLAIALAAIAVESPAAAGAPAGKGVYIALGDSYTSGPLVPMQHGDPIDCGRSDHNYPSLVAAEFKPATFVDVSCGSAETEHMTEPQTGLPAGGTNPPQFDALRPDATLVTVGIGGNDAGLVGVAEECAQLGATDPNGTACRDHYAPGGNDTVGARIEEARPKIDAVLQGIHERSPRARVAIFGYPDVLPRDGTNCYPTVPLSPDDVAYIDALIVRINAMIAEEASKNDAEFVDTYFDSIGHDVCKLPPNRWFEGLVPTEPAYPLHPNAKGEATMARSGIALLKDPAPEARITRLRVAPRRVDRKGKVAIHFRLSRPATVAFTRKRISRAHAKSRSRRVGPAREGVAGNNEIEVPARELGGMRGRFRLIATATGNAALPSHGSARYRVLAKGR